jgi:uncharacterized protein YdhG (YjbR/CyaY superfamily)
MKSKTEMNAVDAYIATFPENVQERLHMLRKIIRRTAPEAVEGMAYGLPAYKLNKKPLVYFGGFEKHVGFYATPTGHSAFSDALKPYKQGKGSVQFPHNQPLPEALIEAMVRFRVEEITQK